MRTAEIVIIGGGLFGVNLAYALANRGAHGVLLLEQDMLASGSSGKGTGGLRQQFADELDIRFATEGMHFYQHFLCENADLFSSAHITPPRFEQHGLLLLCTTPEKWRMMQTWVERQRALDVPTRLLAPPEIQTILPQLVVDDLVGATFCPTDASTDPGTMVRALAGAAQARGVQIQEHTPVTAIQVRRGKVQGVVTPQGTIAAPIVVNATGVAAALVARLAGVKDLPVWPLKRQIYQTEAFEELPLEMPVVVDLGSGFHFRRRENSILLMLPTPLSAEQLQRNRRLEAEAFTLHIEEALWPLLQAEMRRRCPILANATIRRVWAGFYEMTPDEHPILGATGIKGFYNGCGFSGRGFIYAPRAARLLSEALLGDKSHAAELKVFSQERFKKGKLLPSVSLL